MEQTAAPAKDPLVNPSAMTIALLKVVENPGIDKQDLINSVKAFVGPGAVTDGSILTQYSETLKHLRIYYGLGFIDKGYAESLPPMRRNIFEKPSSISHVAMYCAAGGGRASLEDVLNFNHQLPKPVSDASAQYQYNDSRKILQAVKRLGVYKEN
jgi:hypothetical protein